MENLQLYCKTRKTFLLRKLSPEIKELFLKAVPYALEKYKENKTNYWDKALEILDILYLPPLHGEECQNIQGLKWVGNSCYLDSALFSLFAVSTDFIENYIINSTLIKRERKLICGLTPLDDLKNRQNVQNQLKNIVNHIRGKENGLQYCTSLRKTLRHCPNSELYYDERIKDAGDFLTYILSMFDTDVAIKHTLTYYTNNVTDQLPPDEDLVLTSSIFDKEASIIQFINSIYFSNYNPKKLQEIRNFLTIVEDSGEFDFKNKPNYKGKKYSRSISFIKIIQTPYLIFRFERLHTFTEKLIKTHVIPSQTLTIDLDNRFLLSSIVIFQHSHYTCYFRCGNDWYYYNDVNIQKIKKIGTYMKMLRSNPSPLKNGTLYYYIKF
jgi:hypothetical protein